MDPLENVVTDDSDETFTQDEIKSDYKRTYVKNKIDVPKNPFYNIIERQAKEFEEFGKRMSLELQNSYNEYMVQQQEMTKVETDSIEIEKIYKILEEKFEEKFASQSQLIDSLRARIEELETDFIIKNQNIRGLQNEFNEFKKDRSVSTSENKDLKIPNQNGKLSKISDKTQDNKLSKIFDKAQDNEKKFSLDDEGFVCHELWNTESYTYSDNETFEYSREVDNEEHFSLSGSYAGPPISYQQIIEDVCDDYEEKENVFWPSTSYQQSNYDNYIQTDSQKQYEIYDFVSENEQNLFFYNSQSTSNNNSQDASKTKTSTDQKSPYSPRKKKSVSQRIDTEIKGKGAKKLLCQFSITQLLEYEKTDLFKSLGDNERKSVKNIINDGLRIELTGKRNLTQPIEIYVSRRLIPSLPDGFTSYTEFKNSSQYNALNSDKRKRLQKIN